MSKRQRKALRAVWAKLAQLASERPPSSEAEQTIPHVKTHAKYLIHTTR